MKLPVGLGLMILGVIGIARGAAIEAGHQASTLARAPHLAPMLGTFLFVGGLMLVAKRDSFGIDKGDRTQDPEK